MEHEHSNYPVYLTRVLIVRGFMLAAFTLLIAYGLQIGEDHLNLPVLAGLIVLWAIAGIPLLRKRKTSVPAHWLAWHILVDVLTLTLLLYFIGGYSNPLVSFYLFPELIAALMLSPRKAWWVGGIVIIFYTLLMRFYVPLSLFGNSDMMANGGFHLHLLGMWLTFVFSVAVIISVVARMAEQQLQYEQQSSEMRQKNLRDRGFVTLGAQAASDAHEMGTPLNTILLLLEELKADAQQPQHHTLDLMRRQVLHCRDVLKRLSQRARNLSESVPESTPLHLFLAETVALWRNLHPTMLVETPSTSMPSPTIAADPMLAQVLFVVLDNAMEASARQTRITTTWDHENVRVDIEDDGTGFEQDTMHQLGNMPLSSKSDGQGMGLYVAAFIMQQIDGNIDFLNKQGNGACIRLIWSLSPPTVRTVFP